MTIKQFPLDAMVAGTLSLTRVKDSAEITMAFADYKDCSTVYDWIESYLTEEPTPKTAPGPENARVGVTDSAMEAACNSIGIQRGSQSFSDILQFLAALDARK